MGEEVSSTFSPVSSRGARRAEECLEASYAIAGALREARRIDDAGSSLVAAIRRASGAGRVVLRVGGRVVAKLGAEVGGVLAIPLRAKDAIVGVIELGTPASCDEATRRLLTHLAHEIGAFERHRASTAREERWRSLLSAMTQVVWVGDAAGSFNVPQPSWQGYTGQPWTAHRGFGWVDALHPDDRSRAKRGWERAIATRDLWETSGRIWHAPSGKWRSFVARATPLFDDAGSVREWVGTLTDVDDLKRVEQDRAELLAREMEARTLAERERARIYQLFTEAPALISVMLGPEHRLTFVNAAMQRVIGERNAIGAPLRAAVPYDHYVALVEQGFETGERVVGTELPILRDWESNGRPYERWFNFVQEPMRDDHGMVEGVMSFGFDVTDLVTARTRVEAAVRELEATSRAKDEFLATVSHELRTPLGSILGWASLLGERFDDADAVAKGAEVIHRSARAQARIIDDILDVSRIITGKLRIESRPVSLEAVVRGALEVVRTSASAKDIEVDVTLPDEPCVVVGDEERLRQVAWNLLSNAIKFTDRGGRVGIRLTRATTGVTLEVTDSGRGIAPEFLPHVFERFRQADSSTTRAQGGLGLGLAIVRHLVELHGGHVDVSSDGAGRGATFSVSLPIRAVAARLDAELPPALAEALAPDSSSERASDDALEGADVLVVDDELDAREMLGMALSAWGVDVRTAESAAAALRAATEKMPDVVISDIGMPGEDGYAFIGRLRALCRDRGENVTAVALTAYARREDAARAIAAGFDFHVAKPIELDDLRVVVERAIARSIES